MLSSCCIVYCTSGYKSNTEKVSLFLFPKLKALKEKWLKAIPRKNLVVCDRTVVCEKHFTEDQIIRTWESGTGSNKIVINLTRPKLGNDAIPCIFPGPKNLSKPLKKQNYLSKRMLEFESKTIEQVKEVIVKPTPISEYFPEVIFNKIFENPTTTVTLPEGWEYKTNGDKYPFVTYYFVTPYSDISFGVLVAKQISFGKDMVITCKIHNTLFDLKRFGITIPCSPLVTNITSLINLLDGYNVCIGGPLEDKYPGIQNNMTSIGLDQRLRHNKCPYLLDSKEQKKKSCLHCLHLNSAFRMKKKTNGRWQK